MDWGKGGNLQSVCAFVGLPHHPDYHTCAESDSMLHIDLRVPHPLAVCGMSSFTPRGESLYGRRLGIDQVGLFVYSFIAFQNTRVARHTIVYNSRAR